MKMQQVTSSLHAPWTMSAWLSLQFLGPAQRLKLTQKHHWRALMVSGGNSTAITNSGTATLANTSMRWRWSMIPSGVLKLLDQKVQCRLHASHTLTAMIFTSKKEQNTSSRPGNSQTLRKGNKSTFSTSTWAQPIMRPGTFWKPPKDTLSSWTAHTCRDGPTLEVSCG